MARELDIETRSFKYWNKYWEPVRGCKKVSIGCMNCYADKICRRSNRWHYDHFADPSPMEKTPYAPRKGVVNVCGFSDLFGEWNTDGEIVRLLGMLRSTTKNLILTKRAERMAKMNSLLPFEDGFYFGVSCENQMLFDMRAQFLPWLGKHRKWLCLEPLLGPITIPVDFCPVDWIVVGIESGHGRRMAQLEWVEAIADYAKARQIPLFIRTIPDGEKIVKDIKKFPENLRIRQLPWNHGH